MGFHLLGQIINCAAGGIGGGRTCDGVFMQEDFDCIRHLLGACLWDIYHVEYIVLWGPYVGSLQP